MNLDIESLAREMTGEIGEALLKELSNASWDQLKSNEIKELGVSFGSHPGLIRNRHEDRSAVARISAANGEHYFVAVVCDGVGGSEHGDLAASISIATLFSELSRVKTKLPVEEVVCHVIRRMDDKVRSCLFGKGLTTASVVLATSSGEFVGANVGDSRIYTWDSLKDKRLRQVSQDDTLGNEVKRLNIKDVSALAQKGLLASLSQAIGESGRESRDLNIIVNKRSEFSDSVVLSSDGCWKHDPLGFELVVVNAKSSIEASRRALAMANWTGGSDNSSIIVIEDIAKVVEWCVSRAFTDSNCVRVESWIADTKSVFHISYILSVRQSDASSVEKKVVKRVSRSRQKSDDGSLRQMDLVEQSAEKKRSKASLRPEVKISVEPSVTNKNEKY